MGFIYTKLLLLLIVLQIASVYNGFATAANSSTRFHSQEVKELKIIARKLGKTDWELGIDQCSSSSSNGRQDIFVDENNSITCDCSSSSISNLNSSSQSACHVVSIVWKSQNLSGTLPPEFAKLHYLRNLDLSRNYLSGSIPPQWATMRLLELSLMSNQLSGPFPKVLTSITSLTNLSIEGNSFSGRIPPEIGKLINLQKLILSSNAFTGNLPEQLAKLTNLTDMRINDNNFTGKIPDFISHWKLIQKLHIQGCSLEGPIPSSISTLTRLTDLRISDLKGRGSSFPSLRKMDSIKTLTLRRCLLYGEIPMYIADMPKLKNLDLSFNNLSGEIPAKFIQLAKVDFMYLTGNKLTGPIPRWILGMIKIVDISYNNFTWESSGPIECPRGSVNLVESYSSSADNSSRLHSCLKQNFPCSASSNQYHYSFHINCGGKEINVNGTKYIADIEQRGASMFYSGQNWAFSSTGNFMDNNVYSDVYTETNTSSLANVSAASLELYKTARASPLSLTYYGLCLGNGNYTVKLHFAEIIFTNDRTFNSLGRRIFDVYIQGKLVLKDFNIRAEAGGTGIPVVKAFTAAVTSHTLKIHFYWAGKGTTGIPDRGFYGPLVSAISVNPNFKPPVIHSRKINITVVVGAVATSLLLVLLALLITQRKGWLGSKVSSDKELRGIDLQTGLYSLRQMKAATNNFDAENKVGEGGFGAVYKGSLSNGTVIAVKQLSSKSRQGNREFINEIGMISAFQHPNLVKLYGCCVEGNQLMVVYEYLENNCLSRALFGKDASQRLKLDWATRKKICLGIARGLAYLHEESTIKIVHRDIKTSNVLLDKNMNAKISDFGLAKLYEDDKSHISTRIAGTIGYMAPEYAMRGHLTNKADVYSFGVVALEIVSGKSNTSYRPNEEFIYLLDWAYVLQERGSLLELVDPNLGKEYLTEETILTLNVALMCTNASPTLRPTMSQVVSMLEGRTAVQDLLSDPGFLAINSKVKAIRNHFWQNPNQTQSFSLMGNDSKSSILNEGSHLLRASSVQSESNDEKEID